MSRVRSTFVLTVLLSLPAQAQSPQPFPRVAQSTPQAPPLAVPVATPAPRPAGQPAPPAAGQATTPDGGPNAAEVGFPVYPSAQFLASYDAGRGQRFYLYGSTAAFAEIVNYYRTQLNERGNVVFREPPTHSFEVGRFREETMAFPPGVTVKDWTWGGSAGYLNPKLGARPERYPTVIMLVPAPPAAQPAAR